MSGVKVFPVRMSEEFHQKMVEAAQKAGKSLHQYILDVIQAELNK